MPRLRKVLIAAAVVTLGLVAATSVSAGKLQVNAFGFKFVWTPKTFEVSGSSVRCNVTLEGSFTTRSFNKSARVQIGRVTRSTINTCIGGTASPVGLPWPISFSAFSGTLPNITAVTVRFGASQIQISPEALPTCLIRTTEEEPERAILSVSGEEITTIRLDETARILMSGPFFCEFERATLIGTGTARNEEGTGAIRIRLI